MEAQTPDREVDGTEAETASQMRKLPPIKPVTKESRGYVYELKIPQQPDRARMCGFGDKVRGSLSSVANLPNLTRIADQYLRRLLSAYAFTKWGSSR